MGGLHVLHATPRLGSAPLRTFVLADGLRHDQPIIAIVPPVDHAYGATGGVLEDKEAVGKQFHPSSSFFHRHRGHLVRLSGNDASVFKLRHRFLVRGVRCNRVVVLWRCLGGRQLLENDGLPLRQTSPSF